ncbi:MAG: putative aminoglycoside phosphotransferase [Caulobacteraceae bacterium]|nr:putative aminoglycoside phosphotransferase [Caulobacteraceae bacterium]
MRVEDMSARIADVLDAPEVEHLAILSGGASRETWSFVARGRDGARQRYILQIARRVKDHDSVSEAAIMTAAASAGVPVARIVRSSNDGEFLGGRFMIAEFVEGETLGPRILRDPAFADARRALPGQFGRALAAIHTLPVSLIPRGSEAGEDILDQMRRELDELGEPHPAFEVGIRWLADHRPENAIRKFVHGDFRLGNVIVHPEEGLVAVLDWELSRIGAPAEDIAWVCLKPWRFGGAGYVAGIAPLRELLNAYEDAGGGRVAVEDVRWWVICGTVRWGIGCVIQARAHLDGERVSHELAAIGRRACENEYDLLRLIGSNEA